MVFFVCFMVEYKGVLNLDYGKNSWGDWLLRLVYAISLHNAVFADICK